MVATLLVARQALCATPDKAIDAFGGLTKVGLIFIDPSIRGRQLLSFGSKKNSEVVVLAANIPLLEQISSHLKGRRNIGAVHIVSHGESGALLTQGARLDQNSLATTQASTIATIANALSVDADIFLYGCNIAKYGEGADFVKLLAERTGADVTASTNDTGHSSLGADWTLEYQTGSIEDAVVFGEHIQQGWQDKLAIGISVASSTTSLLTALNPDGPIGVSYTGTASISGAFSSNAYGTFTTSGSSLGMTSGAVFGTGDVLQVSGTPSTFWDGPGTGNTVGSEFDRAALTFSFIPQAGVTKVVFRYIMGSEEYNEYVGQNFSDNITIRLNGGAYSNTNVATVPGSSTGIDIDTINASLNSIYYRDNTIASPPVPDSVLDGHTSLLRSITPVVPGTTYSAEIKVADFTDNFWNTALFVDYFGASLQLDLDDNNSSGATAANYSTTFTEAGPAVAIADIDTSINNFDTTSIQSATITLINAKPNDVLSYGSMPSGITASTNTSTPGVITVTLTGTSSIANYQSAISSILYSNSSNVPDTTTRQLDVAINDGTTNSNAASTSITFVSVPTYLYTVSKSASDSSVATPQDLTYTITVQNTGDGIMSGISVTDVLAQGISSTSIALAGPAGDGGAMGQFEIGETWVYSATVPITQANIDNGNDLVNTVSVTSTQTSPAVRTAAAITSITKNPSLSILKTANSPGPVNAGDTIGYTYTVSNTGNITVNSISINDVHNGAGTFPGPSLETLVVDVLPTGDSQDSTIDGVWNSLAPGDSVRFSTNYVVTQADIDNGN